jgi:hypothetical protein
MSVLYYTNASGDGTWENLSNWNTAADNSGSNPTEVPWTDTDGSTSASNLLDATGGDGVSINSTIDPNGDVTGTCDIPYIRSNPAWGSESGGIIYGGTFTGSNVTNEGTILGGTFTGQWFSNEYNGNITGGLFTGSGFTNGPFATISGGSFLGGNFQNIAPAFLASCTLEISGFYNGGASPSYSSISITLGGTPYTGTWQGQIWNNGSWVSVAPLYYTDASGDGTWENLSNWNYSPDGSGANPTEIPWSEVDNSTSASDLIDASGGAGVTIDSAYIGGYEGIGITGSCDIPNITNNSTIEDGTFTGDNFTNNGNIGGGYNPSVPTFTGDNFTNNGSISAGTYSGSNFTNSSSGIINGGLFQYAVFDNIGSIYYSTIYVGTLLDEGYIDPSVTIVYFDRTDPTITPDQNYNVPYNNNLTIHVEPSSNSGGQFHFTLQQQPLGVVINGLTGIITITPDSPATGTFEVYVTQDVYGYYNAVTTPVLVSTVTIDQAVPTITPSGDQNELFYTGMASIPLLQPAQSNSSTTLVYSFSPPVESGWIINPANGTIIAGNPLAFTSWSVSIGVTQAASSDGNYAAITTPVIVSTVNFITLDGLPAIVAIPPSGWRYCTNDAVIVAGSQEELYEAVIAYRIAHGQPVNLGVIDDINAFLKTGLPQLLKSRSCWQSWPECC